MRVVIYGVGAEFLQAFEDKAFIEEALAERGIELVGFADSNPGAWGNTLTWRGKNFQVKSADEFTKNDLDEIWIASTSFFWEIREKLLRAGYEKDQISLLYDFCYGGGFPELKGKHGLEAGGPTDLFANIYTRCDTCDGVNFSAATVWWEGKTIDYCYKGTRLGTVYIADAVDMAVIPSRKYDFLLSSNNLEHIANPLKALKEFSRVLKQGGTALILVPMKSKTFDHNREYTAFDHLLEDFNRDTGEDDLSHLPEIIEKHDYSMDPHCGGRDAFISRAQKNVENRCLHHHVFEEQCLRKALEFAGFTVVKFGKILTNWFIIGKKQ